MSNSKFYVYVFQDGGCDYTIACGKKLLYLCDNREEIDGALEKFIGEYAELDFAEVYEVVDRIPVKLQDIYDKISKQVEKEAQDKEQAKELQLLNELKAKYPEHA